MGFKSKLWLGVGVFALSGALPQVVGGAGADFAIAPAYAGTHAGGEGGEGGGEGGAKTQALLDDVGFLKQLGLVDGHLTVGIALYREDAAAAAKTHMKHPGDELFATLKPALAARKAPDFSNELTALSQAVETGADPAAANAAYTAVSKKIDAARATVKASLADRLKVIVALVRTAGDEYAVAVKNGAVVEAHEYQDAWGFTAVAQRLLEGLSSADKAKMGTRYDSFAKEFTDLQIAWPALQPPKSVASDASLLYAAAARMELAALEIK